VSDASGGVVPNAKIMLADASSGSSRETVTNAEGSGHGFGEAGTIGKNDDVPGAVDLGWRLLGACARHAAAAKQTTEPRREKRDAKMGRFMTLTILHGLPA
jgi:hypothetical protein